jgi:hypothetical protein
MIGFLFVERASEAPDKHGVNAKARPFWDDESARHEEELSERKGFNDAIDLALKRGWPIIVADASRFSRT